VAEIVKVVGARETVGVPLTTQVEGLISRPAGSEGVIEQFVMGEPLSFKELGDMEMETPAVVEAAENSISGGKDSATSSLAVKPEKMALSVPLHPPMREINAIASRCFILPLNFKHQTLRSIIDRSAQDLK
jgi:hypothetical protein